MQPVTSPSRFRLVGYMLLLSLIYFTLTRAGLSVWSWSVTNASLLDVLHLLLVGLVYDLSFYAYAAILPVLYLFFFPDRWWRSRFNSILTQGAFLVSIYGLGFVAVAEFLFWEEFSVRFNFISVDYLVYSREVIDNINQSYPLPLLLGSIYRYRTGFRAVATRPSAHTGNPRVLLEKSCKSNSLVGLASGSIWLCQSGFAPVFHQQPPK